MPYEMPQVLGKYHLVFDGDMYKKVMPWLREAGLVPMNVADIMRARLEAINSDDPTKKGFWLQQLYTADGVACHNGKIKILLDPLELRDIKPGTELSRGTLILTPKQYAGLEGEEFSREDLEKEGLNRDLSNSEAKSHPVWQALARDPYLLSEYVDAIFKEIKKTYKMYNNTDKAMAVYSFLSSKQENPSMRAWLVENIKSGSNVYGNVLLDSYARLVGIRAEGATQETLEEKIL